MSQLPYHFDFQLKQKKMKVTGILIWLVVNMLGITIELSAQNIVAIRPFYNSFKIVQSQIHYLHFSFKNDLLVLLFFIFMD